MVRVDFLHILFYFFHEDWKCRMVINEIELELRDALARLYDPGFQPSSKLCALLDCENEERAVSIQCKITEGIELLKPSEEVPPSARLFRFYDLLKNRFVLRLTLEETALRMHMSMSSTWREQRAAIHALSVELWRQKQAKLPAESREGSPGQSPEWSEQARRELASLHSIEPDAVAEVDALVQQVVVLEKGLFEKRGMTLEVGPIKPDLVAAVHPSVFRQILIIIIGRFLRQMSKGKITLFGRLEDGNVKISISGLIEIDPEQFGQMLNGELPLPENSSTEMVYDGRRVLFWVKLPALADRLNVLVVDDNIDMVHYYQRSVEGTSYRIVPAEPNLDLMAEIQKVKPEIILLDVMLPNIDGWELLMRLRANPQTREIPVVICSVVKEEELALSLGATRFVLKPVTSLDFVSALDQVLAQVP